jgi:hypothetical protein
LKYIGKGEKRGSSFINLVQIITLTKMKKIYKDLEGRFELVNRQIALGLKWRKPISNYHGQIA